MTAQKNHIFGSLFYSLCRSLGFCFFVNRRTMKCFSMKLNKYLESFCCYVLLVSTTLKNVFSRSNFSDNSVHVPILMHFNMQSFYDTIVLGRRRRRRRPHCARSLMTFQSSIVFCSTSVNLDTHRIQDHSAAL